MGSPAVRVRVSFTVECSGVQDAERHRLRRRLPSVDGLDTVPVWTNREATTLREIPDRVVMVGGSAVGTESGRFLHRFGARVTIVERSAALMFRENSVLVRSSASGCALRASTCAPAPPPPRFAVTAPTQSSLSTMASCCGVNQGSLLGTWAVAPMAGEWMYQAALAIRTRTAIEVLLEQVAQFPTYSEVSSPRWRTRPEPAHAGDGGR